MYGNHGSTDSGDIIGCSNDGCIAGYANDNVSGEMVLVGSVDDTGTSNLNKTDSSTNFRRN